MDGPNVNWSFFEKFSNIVEGEYGVKLLNVGSCGLHTIHNSFKTGALETKWELDQFLWALARLFQDVPARRDDYEQLTAGTAGSGLYPKKYCAHRWLDNLLVAQRAIDMLPSVKLYLKAVKDGKCKAPDTKSFATVRTHCEDLLLEAKLACFISISKIMEPFLRQYQTDNIMLPFICEDITKIVIALLNRFMKFEARTTLQLLQVNLAENHLDPKKVDVGFVAEEKVKSLLHKKKISEHHVMSWSSGWLLNSF
jgi:hypothetical protein